MMLPENTQAIVNCFDPTPTINIIYAYYGSLNCSICNCTDMDKTNYIDSYCVGNGNSSFCTFTAGNSFFTDTCPGVVKHFWLTYFCS
jgi:hypothetical protein